jgi:hypothetical protein
VLFFNFIISSSEKVRLVLCFNNFSTYFTMSTKINKKTINKAVNKERRIA